ncbi:MAG: glycosyl hydrolase family 57 [Deltaproteobacteria bacterium]|nr:glycosyl hydrolase family 57 [Deltaproteobacteria bacterium]
MSATIALHMHQPLIPAGGSDLQTADVISNLQDMFNNQGVGDNHNASVFQWCYKRIGEFVPELVAEGKEPRVMLEYSGNLLWGLQKMGLNDVLDALKGVTCNSNYHRHVEWLGCPWGHAVAPSTPVQDYRLHVIEWRKFFAELFGSEALARVKGFSPSEMALPNHPDIAYEFVKTLKENGYTYVLVQEHTIEDPQTSYGPKERYFPNRLVCKNTKGEELSITCLIKTQGSDTKLVAQMQPWYEACSLAPIEFKGHTLPRLVTQIADGENGGVMMNEFPDKYKEVVRISTNSQTPLVNGSEYLEMLAKLGISENDLPVVQPIYQKRIWDKFIPGDSQEKFDQAITELKNADSRFHMEGGSWTNNISWVKGYDNLLGPMEQASVAFNERYIRPQVDPNEQGYKSALFNLMCAQTSCFRYWGQGVWTDYGREFCRRTISLCR